MFDQSDASDSIAISITDAKGNTFDFSKPVDHVIVFGYAATVTVAEAGAIDKIIATDMYSQYSYYGDQRLKEMDAYNLGTPYSSMDTDAVVAWILNAVQEGKFNLETDAFIITDSSSAYNKLYSVLTGYGMKNILFWGSVSSFGDVVERVDSISKIVSGNDNALSKEVNDIYNASKQYADSDPKSDFIYLWYDASKGIGIGNDSCLGGSLITAAGGNNLAPGDVEYTSGIYYGGIATVLSILEQNKDTKIFLASGFNLTAEEFSSQYLGGSSDYDILVMDSMWNRACPDAVKSVETVHGLLYADSENVPGSEESNIYIYVVAALIIIVAVGIVGYVFMTKKHNE